MLITDLEKLDFFEGTEKLLEIWFKTSDSKGLRSIPYEKYDALVQSVNAEIVKYASNEYIDSYVLSESSMFVARDRFLIKTCGRTKLLACIQPLMQLVKEYLNTDTVQNMFYSRRVYLRPDLQEENYQSFEEEAEQLEEIFPNGNTYTFGNKKGEEWYLYTMDNNTCDHIENSDATLEILMSDLDPNTMLQFTKACYPDDDLMTQGTGISKIIPESKHHGVVFDPCGYSMNGLLQDTYSTIHVTPQPQCSYVSYETNYQAKDYNNIVDSVLKTFKPAKFIVTLFANKGAHCGLASQAMKRLSPNGYHCVDLEEKHLKNYSFAYGHFRQNKYA